MVSKAAGAGKGCSSVVVAGQETTTFVSKAGCTVSIERMDKGDKSMKAEQMNDKLELEEGRMLKGRQR